VCPGGYLPLAKPKAAFLPPVALAVDPSRRPAGAAGALPKLPAMTTLTPHLLKRSWRSWTSSDLEVHGPGWLQWVWTALFALACAAVFTVFGVLFSTKASVWTDPAQWWRWYKVNLFISAFIAFGIHIAFELLTRWIGPARIKAWTEGRRALFFTSVPLGGVAVLWPTAVWLMGYGFAGLGAGGAGPRVNIGFLVFALMFSLVMFLYFGGKARLEAANRRAAEARLRLLQGQIEPHFLFNTLANVVGLIDADPARARAMLESFIDYLRGSLGGLRNRDHTLGHELALIDAYLRVLALRMDGRLRVRLDVPAELHALRLPPVLVQPLVENAITHGLEPKVEGGEVVVRAEVSGKTLQIDVLDDGLGLRAHAAAGRRAGAGAALANIRERLHAAYGSAASLLVENRPEGGVCARLLLPWPLPTTDDAH
jgi:hypothetical protein